MSIFSSFFGDSKQSSMITSSLEMVINAAGLVSNTGDVDRSLDAVRIMTSKSNTRSVRSEADDAILFKVYLQLEEYLRTKEPIRSFTRAELRGKFSSELLQRLEDYEAKYNAND